MYSWSSSCPSFAGNDGDNDGYSRYDNGTCGAWGRRQENTKSTKQRISLDKIPKLLSYLARNLRQITRNTLKKHILTCGWNIAFIFWEHHLKT